MFWRQAVAQAGAERAPTDAPEPTPPDQFRGSFSGFERNRFYLNPRGRARFVELGYSLGLDFNDDGRAFVPIDFDGDGDLDLPVLSLQGLRLMENQLPTEGRHFARVKLEARKTQHHALGARVFVEAGGVRQQDYVKATAGFQTQVPLELHFGLGAATQIDNLEVRWPSGHVQTFKGLVADRRIELVEGGQPKLSALKAWPHDARPRPSGAFDLAQPLAVVGDERKQALRVGGKPLLVNFWAPWCKPCNRELPELVEAATRMGDRVDFAGVSVETKDHASVEAAITKHRLKYRQLYANDALMASFFGGDGSAPLPSTFVFDRAGTLRRAFHRPIGADDLIGVLSALDEESAASSSLSIFGEASLARNDLAGAKVDFERALAADPKSALAMTQLATIADLTGAPDRAIELLERATALEPNLGYAWYRLGAVYKRTKKLKEALVAYRRAAEIQPKEPSFLVGVGVVSSQLGDDVEATKVFERVVAFDPKNVEAWLLLSKTRMLLGRRDARQSLERVLVLAPGHPEGKHLMELLQQDPRLR